MNSKSSTRTIVATGLGTAVFLVLFMFVKIPSPVPETNLQIAYGVSSFFAVVFGPLSGFFVAFVGHALTDFISYGSPWWSWVIASGISALITGLASKKLADKIESGVFDKHDMIYFSLFAVIGNAAAWLLAAPLLDILLYAEPASLVFAQGGIAFVMDAIVSVVIGIILLKAYASTKTGKGSLSKE